MGICQSLWVFLKPKIRIFLENSSLRGVGKILRYSGFLQCVWILYVLGMVGILVTAMISLVNAYYEQTTYYHTTVVRSQSTAFPALTVCSHNPFSPKALKLWSTGEVVSPNSFNVMIRRITNKLLNQSLPRAAGQIFSYDTIRVYFQNLDVNASQQIGFSANELFVFCASYFTKDLYYSGNRLEDCLLKAKPISSSVFFNCYTVEPVNYTSSVTIKEILLVVSSNTRTATVNKFNEAFYQEALEQALGTRIKLHEGNILPDMNAEKAFNVGPGKLTEVTYKIQEDLEMPTENCQPGFTRNIVDLNVSYNYSYDACVGAKVNKEVVTKCGCLLAYLPRPIMPSANTPYCGRIDEHNVSIFFERLTCLGKAKLAFKQLDLDIRYNKSRCPKLCKNRIYNTHQSTNKWHIPIDKLSWQIDLTYRLRDLQSNISDMSARQRLIQYLQKIDNQKNKKEAAAQLANTIDPKDTSCIIVRRSSYDIIRNLETPTISFLAMLSQMGGLGSITIGLTCAFFVELIEYVFLLSQRWKKKKEDKEEE